MGELLWIVAANGVFAWIATYLVHSYCLLGATVIVERRAAVSMRERVRFWRAALLLPLLTSTAQTALGASWSPVAVQPTAIEGTFGELRYLSLGVVVVVGLLVLTAAVALVASGMRVNVVLGRERRPVTTFRPLLKSLGAEEPLPVVTLSHVLSVPAAVGLREICVPASGFAQLDKGTQRSLLAHELGHLRHRDALWFAVAEFLVRAIPIQRHNRMVLARLRELAEFAADDFAVAATGDSVGLAQALLSLAETAANGPAVASAAGAPLTRRVERLLCLDRSERSNRRATSPLILVACSLVLVLLAPGIAFSPERAGDAIPWLAPSREQPNTRMLEVRRQSQRIRDELRVVAR